MNTDNVISFFENEYPLIKIFKYGNEILIYDAKPHFAFIISHKEIDVLIDFLRETPEAEIIKRHSMQFRAEDSKQLVAKFKELTGCGVFIKGPVAEISPVDRNAIKEQLMYYDTNLLLRKFCLEVTENCNFACTYCKRTIATKHENQLRSNLREEKAYKGIDYYFTKYITFFAKLSKEKKELLLQIAPPSLSWYGGEPFLNFNLIKKSGEYFKNLPWANYGISVSNLRFTANTNLSIMNDEILNFLVDNKVALFASLDGPAEEHNKCRIFINGEGTFATAYSNLLKIKEFNTAYFQEKVSIFGVYTEKHDYGKCIAFTKNIGALVCKHFPAEYAGVFVSNYGATLQYYKKALESNLQEFKKRVLLEIENVEMDYFSNLFAFAKLNYDHPMGENSLKLLLTCPMGFDNVMVAANGDFLICHKVDGSMPIGDCDLGLDYEKLIDLNQHYNSVINNDECKNCWNVNFCSECGASRMVDNHFINPTKKECDLFRWRADYNFSCFIHLSLEHPDLLEKIFAHRNDQKNFIGIIDINEF